MAVKKITASESYQTLFTVPKHEVGKISSVVVTNKTPTSVPVMVIIEDFFTPDASVGVTSPTATSQEVCRLVVGAGLTGSLGEQELKDIRCFGTVKAICDGTQSACYIDTYYNCE
ncbi:MAG: hypothetical protein WC551_07935 [Patescibacteria group bacterium]